MGDARLSIDEVLIALKQIKKSGDGYLAQCPAHEDRTASLSVSHGEHGRILLHCFAGCSHDAIVAALGLTPKQISADRRERKTYVPTSGRQEAVYDYRDAEGVLRYQVVRKRLPNGDKTFQQRRPDPDKPGEWIYKTAGIPKFPYRLNQLKEHSTIYVVEGEKDADRLWAEGLPATTNVGGSGKSWNDVYSEALKAVGVTKAILIPDNDDAGRKHMHAVAQSLKSVGIVITYVPLPDVKLKGDISDWMLLGHTRADLEQLVASKFSVIPPNAELVVPVATIDDEVNEIRRNTPARHAEMFAERFGGAFKFNHLRDKWMRYETPCWQIDADLGIYRAALEFALAQQQEAVRMTDRAAKKEAVSAAVKAESPATIDNMLKLAKANLVFSDRGENWDADPWLLAVTNGVVELKTGTLRPGSPADRISLKCAVPYDKEAQCPRWWQFLAEIFGGDEEIVEFVWRLCGYCLTGQTTERIVPMLYGRGANGKSVFLNVLATILGDYSFTLPFSSLQFQKQEGIPNDLAALVGRRFVTMIEANDGLRLNEAKLKTLSGNDRISARFLNCEFFTFQPVAKFVLAMNHKPIAKDDSPGFWDRIRLVPFLHTFPEGSRDEGLQARLIATEGAGILAWAIEGCVRWQESGLTKPKAVIAATAEYQADSDQLSEFLSTCCSVENLGSLTGAGGVQKAYNGWADNRGLSKFERLSSTALGRLLSERFQKRRTMNGLFYVGLEVSNQSLWSSH